MWRLLIPAALVVLVLAQAATALHWFGLGDATATIGGPSRPAAPVGHVAIDRDPRGR